MISASATGDGHLFNSIIWLYQLRYHTVHCGGCRKSPGGHVHPASMTLPIPPLGTRMHHYPSVCLEAGTAPPSVSVDIMHELLFTVCIRADLSPLLSFNPPVSLLILLSIFHVSLLHSLYMHGEGIKMDPLTIERLPTPFYKETRHLNSGFVLVMPHLQFWFACCG